MSTHPDSMVAFSVANPHTPVRKTESLESPR